MLKQKRLFLLLPFCTALLSAMLAWFCLRGTAMSGNAVWLWTALAGLAGGAGAALILHSQGKGLSAEKLFLLLFVPLSLAMMLAMPMGRVPDEDSHLQRIWLLSQGQIFPGQDQNLTEPSGLMDGIYDTDTTHSSLKAMQELQISSKRTASSAGFNTGIYPPVSYLPQALAVAVTRLFTANRLALFYAARVGGWLATILLMYFAIRLLPKGKYGLLAVSLMPIILQEGMSASVDGMALGAVSLLCAWVMRRRIDGTPLTGLSILQLTLLCLLTVACKMIYAPFILMVFALPKPLWKCRGGKAAGICITLGVTLLISLGWLALCYVRYVAGQGMTEGSTGVGTILPQLQYMLSHPLSFVTVILRTLITRLYSWLHTMLGSGLSALNIRVPMAVLLIEAAGLLAVWLTDTVLPSHGFKSLRRLMPLCGVLSLLVMLCGLYAWWNPYQAAVIEGLQGRYLIPLLMPALCGVRFRKAGKAFGDGQYASAALCLCLPAAISCILRVWACCL